MSVQVSIYGKLPAHADYVLVSLPSTLEVQLHQWLSTIIFETESLLGKDAWLNAFLTTQPLCFLLNLDVKEPVSLFGVMIPSVDKVGRYFPLITGIYLTKHFQLNDLDKPLLGGLANAMVNEQVSVMHDYQSVEILQKKIMNLKELDSIREYAVKASSSSLLSSLQKLKKHPIISSCWWELDNPHQGIETHELPSSAYYQSILSKGADS